MTVTCKGCHRSWTGHSQCHCSVCHAHFSGYNAADMHLKVSRDGETITHLEPGELRHKDGSPKLLLDDRGVWHTPGPAGGLPHWAKAS